VKRTTVVHLRVAKGLASSEEEGSRGGKKGKGCKERGKPAGGEKDVCHTKTSNTKKRIIMPKREIQIRPAEKHARPAIKNVQ